MDFSGLKCGICGEKLKDGDDVVVCPDCGTPMHRACYKETGFCPNQDRHDDGYVFDGFETIKRSARGESGTQNDETEKSSNKPTPSADKLCPICGSRNRQGANFCDNCGTRISSNVPNVITADPAEVDFSDPQFFASYALGQASDVPASDVYEENITAGDVACYVAVNTPYYLGAFKRIKNGSGRFNFSAAVFSGVWFLYRKLYKFGALMLSIEALLYALKMYFTQTVSLDVMNKLLGTIGLSVNNMSQITMEQYMQLSAEMQKMSASDQALLMVPTLLFVLQLIVMAVSGTVANKVYYKSCIEKIREVKKLAAEQSLSRSEISQSLYMSGGVNAMLAGVFGFIYIFLLFM